MKRKLTISELNNRPFIRIIGKYLEKFEFSAGDEIQIDLSQNKIIITNMNKPKYYLTDLGQDLILESQDGQIEMVLDRYGVWKQERNEKAEVVETSSNLEYLKNKYGVKEVISIK